jgi:hypothetical protein
VEEQRQEVWSRPRYAGIDEAKLQETLAEAFFEWHGGNSEMFDQFPLHGLWAANDVTEPDLCSEGPGIFPGELIHFYILNHDVSSLSLEGSTYHLVVEPTERGYLHIEFRNRLYRADGPVVSYEVDIVDSEGQLLASFPSCAPRDKAKACPPAV